MQGSWVLEVDRTALERTRIIRSPAPPGLDGDFGGGGEIVVATECFALTANSIAYAILGEALAYWEVFPADEGWGRFPVWGVARVIASSHTEFAEGERIFGMLPPSTHARFRPAAVGDAHFLDGARHRRSLHPAYNFYVRTDRDPLISAIDPHELALTRPLFIASYLLDLHLADKGWFDARTVVLTSASSKTAIGLALQHHARAGARPKLTGLTSIANIGFVRSLGLYDEVVAYADAVDIAGPLAVVDLAGDRALKAAMIENGQVEIGHWIDVGFTHTRSVQADGASMAPEGMFFAPDHIRARIAERGGVQFEADLAAALGRYLAFVRPRLTPARIAEPDELVRHYLQLLDGKAATGAGTIVDFTHRIRSPSEQPTPL